MIRKWLATIAIVLIMNFTVGAQEQPSEQSDEQSPVQPAGKPVEKSPAESEKQPPEQSPKRSPASPEQRSATQSGEESPKQSTTKADEQPDPSTEQSETEAKEQPPAQSAEQPSTRSVERPTAQSPAPLAKLPPANAYRLTVTIHGAFGLCHNDEFGSEELYVLVKRLDLDLQDRIDDIEREAQQITGRTSWRFAELRVDSLRKQDFNSKSAPLSEAELESLERFRGMKATERTRDEDREFRLLRARQPISTADASVMARMKELQTQRRRLLRRIEMRSSANEPGSLRVYPDDELQVVLMEDDPFFDDTCFGSTVLLDESSLATPSLEIKKDDKTLLTLNFRPLSR